MLAQADIKIVVGVIVQNESLYAKYAISAIYPYVDCFVIVDGGSKDNTLEIIKALDKDQKIIIIQSPFNNDYANARNTYLKFIRQRVWNPNQDATNWYYWRLDMDEWYGGHLDQLKPFVANHLDKAGFRFHSAALDTDHFHLNEVNPKESRVNLFKYNPAIVYRGSIHEMPIYHAQGFEIPLYGDPSGDMELGIMEMPPEIGWYLHAPYCDRERCYQKALNYTRQYVKQGTVTQEKLNLMLKKGQPGWDWWWTDHKSDLKADQFAYPIVLKEAPFIQNPPFKILIEDGSVLEPKKELVNA